MITERIVLSLWVGALWGVGYLAVPVLFASLEDRTLAGELAGTMFRLINGVGLICGCCLLVSALATGGAQALRAWRSWVILLMMVIAAAILLVIQPQMAALKVEAVAAGTALSPSFGRLHGLSSGLYMLASVAGLVLVAAGRRGH